MNVANAKVPERYRIPIIMLRKIVICLTCILAGSWPATAQTDAPFKLFEDLLFSGEPPDFRLFGFDHLTLATPHVLGFDVPRPDQVQKALALPRTNKFMAIDIEHWPLNGTALDRASSIAKYKATLSAIKQADPSLKLGLYSVLPIADYWRANGSEGDKALRDWKSRNDEISSALLPYVDVLFPSVYTPYSDEDAWVVFARANIDEARRISKGKPVYCFLWPQFHTTRAFLPGDFWYAQLDTCRKFADGLVIWGTVALSPIYRPEKWDENAEWWQATLRFLREQGKIP
ncbi:hypothetical protein [Mesorhizobium sp.]|uniref:hypothetical protein n=1 Tax=Mesorhizobium sp. TaxID=1871066 RepID=UPI000FEA7278|nr:hypothetical protein [Mesorhizobium sp.]RWF04418.1 MAG: hypothetical protein EOS43_03380 [Mesorhizobium sp.]RWF52880.1 MAG: hypothetical protein EOS50_23365 [Mesorhizobium sp.]